MICGHSLVSEYQSGFSVKAFQKLWTSSADSMSYIFPASLPKTESCNFKCYYPLIRMQAGKASVVDSYPYSKRKQLGG